MTYTDAVHLRKRVEFPKLRMETNYPKKSKSGINQKDGGKNTKRKWHVCPRRVRKTYI